MQGNPSPQVKNSKSSRGRDLFDGSPGLQWSKSPKKSPYIIARLKFNSLSTKLIAQNLPTNKARDIMSLARQNQPEEKF